MRLIFIKTPVAAFGGCLAERQDRNGWVLAKGYSAGSSTGAP
jgi:hypothetical protein